MSRGHAEGQAARSWRDREGRSLGPGGDTNKDPTGPEMYRHRHRQRQKRDMKCGRERNGDTASDRGRWKEPQIDRD